MPINFFPRFRKAPQAGAGAWVYIDGAAVGSGSAITTSVSGYSWILIIISLLSYVMINGMSWTDLVDEERSVSGRARLFLIFSVLLQAGALTTAAIVMGTVYLDEKNQGKVQEWSGISLFLGNMLVAFGCWFQRLNTLPPRDEAMIGLM